MRLTEQGDSHFQPVGHGFGDGGLEGGANVGDILIGQCAQSVNHLPHRRLEAGKRKVAILAAFQRPGKFEARRIAMAGPEFHLRTAGISQPQQFRHLVEGLAQRVVNCGAEAMIMADTLDNLELRMTA